MERSEIGTGTPRKRKNYSIYFNKVAITRNPLILEMIKDYENKFGHFNLNKKT